MMSNDIVQNIAEMMDTILDSKFDKYLADVVTKTDLDEILDKRLADMVTKADLDEILDKRLADMATMTDLNKVLDKRLVHMVTKKELEETRRSIENCLLCQMDIVQEKFNEHFAELKADINMLKRGVFTGVCRNTIDCFLAERVEEHGKRIDAIEKRIS